MFAMDNTNDEERLARKQASQKAAKKRYRESAKGKAKEQQYRDEHKAEHKAWRHANKDSEKAQRQTAEYRAKQKAWNATPKRQEYMRAFQASEKRQAYLASAEFKEMNRAYKATEDCKAKDRARHNERYAEREYREMVRARVRARGATQYKEAVGCLNPNCGWKLPYVGAMLDFHHLEDKKFRIGQGLMPLDVVQDEARKCTLLCSNCHRLVHRGLLDASLFARCNIREWNYKAG
jgi:predicted HNH restriction endonuclease